MHFNFNIRKWALKKINLFKILYPVMHKIIFCIAKYYFMTILKR